MKPENIQAFTPLFLGAIALITAIAVITSPGMSDLSRAAGFGFANAAIAGASGLAQNRNTDSTQSQGSSKTKE